MQNESGLSPLEFNVVVRMDPVKTKTAGGLYLPETKKDRDEMSADEGTLVAISPHAFDYADWGAHPKPQPGDRVLFAQFDGRLWERGGVKYRLIKDKSLIAVIDPAASLVAAA